MNFERTPLPMQNSHRPEAQPSGVPAAPVPPTTAAVAGEQPAAPAQVNLSPEGIAGLEQQIIEVLCTCFDPEVPVNIYELGLIYGIDITPQGAVTIRMTLTSPACPVAGSLPPEVQRKVESIAQVNGAKVEVVWDPPWTKDRMSEAAKLQLGIED
jgi:FeS assembly SUF system protein